MKRYIFLLAILLFAFCACHKDSPTIANGKVIDKKTGGPLVGAEIDFQLKKMDSGGNNYIYTHASSDINGNFSYESTVEFVVFNVSKQGYLTKGPGDTKVYLKQGETNEITINMIPIDGILRLMINNVTGQYDSIYVLVYSPSRQAESFLSEGIVSFDYPDLPFVFGETYSKDIPVVSGENLDIYWSNNPLLNPLSASPNHASVYVSQNDTTDYTISF